MMGRAAVAWSSLALAVSPVMTYFSRFYIQETLLASSSWSVSRPRSGATCARPGWGWAAGAGLCAGMMYATKETSVIAFGAAAAAFVLAGGSKEPRRRAAVIPS